MPVKIRLQRKGRTKRPFYHIVIADSRSGREGRFIEKIGIYNPLTSPATIEIDRDKAYDWLIKGAQPTDTVRAILRFKGVMYRKHLMLGVQKGAITIEQADEKYLKWTTEKEAKIAARVAKKDEEQRAFHARVAGVGIMPAPKVKPQEVVVEEAVEETVEAAVEAAEETAAEVQEEVVAAVEEETQETPVAAAEETEAPAAEETTEESAGEEA
ncbi:MAG: 30S ribosomal protein S16 [Saprospiraceae bacterium]|nr:30S ribosomal protein S16 [Saprospiraceae bacterium]